MITVAHFVLGGFMVLGIHHAVALARAVRMLSRSRALLTTAPLPEGDNAYPYVAVLIPALRETRTMRAIMQRLREVTYPQNRLRVIVVTSEREDEHGPVRPTTADVVDAFIAERHKEDGGRFLRLHYRDVRGVKADQLNFAVNALQEYWPAFHTAHIAYVAVYDADSAMEDGVFDLLARDVYIHGPADAYQQPTLYTKNIGILDVFGHAFALLQSAYALWYEVCTLAKESVRIGRGSRRIVGRPMRYAIGHGFFIRRDVLAALGGFPSPAEDTRIGHIFSFLGRDIRLLPSFDVVESAPGMLSRVRQAAGWAVGEGLVAADLAIARLYGTVGALTAGWLIIYKVYRNAVWALRGFLLPVVVVVCGSIAHAPIAAAAAYALYLCLPSLALVWHARFIEPLTPKEGRGTLSRYPMGAWAALGIEHIAMSAGPLIGFLRLLRHRRADTRLLLGKTERPGPSTHATSYYSGFWNEHAHSSVPWQQRIIDDFLQMAGIHAGDAVLDVGAGIGNNVPTILRFTSALTAVDVSAEALHRLREHHGARLPHLVTLVADGARLPLHDASCRAVICTEVLEHCENPVAVLSECARVLAPGGYYIVSTPNYANPAGLVKFVWERFHPGRSWDPWGNHEEGAEAFMTARRLRVLVERAGFTVIEERGGDLLRSWLPWMRNHYIYIDKKPFLRFGRRWFARRHLMNIFLLARKEESRCASN